MILDTIYDVPLTSVLFVSVTQNSHKYVPCAINYLYQRCLVMGVRPTGFYNVAKIVLIFIPGETKAGL